jgi:hypothetical protein
MNWYKISARLSPLERIAMETRRYILTQIPSLDDECLRASRHLAQVLIDNDYNSANVVKGVFKTDKPDLEAYEEWKDDVELDDNDAESAKFTAVHYWVQVDGLVVDITASQYNRFMNSPISDVTIGNIDSLDRYIIQEEYYIEPRIMF